MPAMTRDEFNKALESLEAKAPKRGQMADFARLQDFSIKAQVAAERLTASPEWNTFLSYLQESLERLEAALEATRAQVLDPNVLDERTLILLKVRLAQLEGARHSLAWASDLPKSIIENGQIARGLEIPNDSDRGGAG